MRNVDYLNSSGKTVGGRTQFIPTGCPKMAPSIFDVKNVKPRDKNYRLSRKRKNAAKPLHPST